MGIKIGYQRVSTDQQVLDRQEDALKGAGCDRIFSDFAESGRKNSRPAFDEMLAFLREGDQLVVTELSRLGRSTKHLLELADQLRAKGIDLVILNLGVDTGTISGKLVLTILAAVSEMEVELLRERTRSGLAAARERGHFGGRTKTYTAQQCQVARMLRDHGQMTAPEIADLLGVSRATYFRALKDFLDTEPVSA